MVDAEPIGQLDLVEGVLEQLELTALVPRPRELVLVEDAESHFSPLARPLSRLPAVALARRRSCPLPGLSVGRASLPEPASRGNTSAVEPDLLHAAQ
jgi:hypothetical protein